MHYWNSFIHNQDVKPVIVASHSDIVELNGENPFQKTTQILTSAFGAQGGSYSTIVTDCTQRTSDNLEDIITKISTLSDEYNKSLCISIQVHFLKYLFQKCSMKSKIVCKFNDVIDLVHSTDATMLRNCGLIPTDKELLSDHLTTLSNNGELLYLKSKDKALGWIVFNVNFLLSSVNTALFSHKSVPHISSKTGVVSLSEIRQLLPNNDSKMIVELMVHLDICCKIDHSVVKLLNKDEFCTNDLEEYFFFPHFVNIDLCVDNITRFSRCRCGWHCRQSNDNEVSTKRFAQIAILKLMRSFINSNSKQATSAQRICTVWKTGIQWQNCNGIQVFVKVVEQHCTVVVEVGSPKENGTEMLCSEIRQIILDAKDKALGAIEFVDTFIPPEQYRTQQKLENSSMYQNV